jgi:hypothetical protein
VLGKRRRSEGCAGSKRATITMTSTLTLSQLLGGLSH